MSGQSFSTLQRKTAAAGAALLVISFLTGVLLAAAMTKKVDADAADIKAAHLNALFGCFWLILLALTLPMVKFGDAGKKRLVLATALPSYANWIVTAVKAFLKVDGVDFTGDPTNDAVFGVLGVLVVAPSFIAAAAWTWGLARSPAPTASE